MKDVWDIEKKESSVVLSEKIERVWINLAKK